MGLGPLAPLKTWNWDLGALGSSPGLVSCELCDLGPLGREFQVWLHSTSVSCGLSREPGETMTGKALSQDQSPVHRSTVVGGPRK